MSNDTFSSVILALLVIPWFVALLLYIRSKRVSQQKKMAEAGRESAERILSELQEKYRPIEDIHAYVNKLKQSTEDDVERLKTETYAALEEEKRQTSEAVAAQRQQAATTLDNAKTEAELIISQAQNEAQRIAGDALEAKQKADTYSSAITAMKNVIDGYKDDYIVPNQSVLDDLAEEYSHKEAGQQLKDQRKRVRQMVKDGRAADCDYKETHRRNYAIHFAVDAFNGKVDTALAKVKHDNYGKLKQEIEDAAALVNHNGSAFRNARINNLYLEARLEELKWAVATMELQRKERDEQRELREQMREEEKVRREIEKAIKEAEKEERMLQKAMTKARAELEAASEADREKFQAQIIDLETRLKDAEDKEQRAISMAQQTRRGHVYIISNIGSFGERTFKIGMTRRLEPLDRIKELGDASVPFPFDVHAMIPSEDAPALESELHNVFDGARLNMVNTRKEFFDTSLAEIRQVIERKIGADVHWTMKAEALEYRESLSLKRKQAVPATA